MIMFTCPVCGNDLYDICYTSYPPKYGKQCMNCGWNSGVINEEITRVPYPCNNNDESKLNREMSDYFCIPCNLCNKYFNKDGSCPAEIDSCNSIKHWDLLMERIKRHEKD